MARIIAFTHQLYNPISGLDSMIEIVQIRDPLNCSLPLVPKLYKFTDGNKKCNS